MFKASAKKMITSENVGLEGQFINFFILWKSYVLEIFNFLYFKPLHLV